MNSSLVRPWLVRWMFAVSIGHIVGGILLAWFAHSEFLSPYHQLVLKFFWPEYIPSAARELHIWWLSLFGATLQNLGLCMMVLTYMGNRVRSPFVWGWMIVGLVIWAPQDMLISMQANVSAHLWVDAIALLVMLPPLFVLWRNDRQ